MNVLVVSASMGAGHDGAARELHRRLRNGGHEARVVDFLKAMPGGVGTALRATYQAQLRLAPWSYEATYRLCSRVPSLSRPLDGVLAAATRRALGRWIRETEPDVVVSTYPLSSLALGRARGRGELAVPLVTFVTDHAVHPLWTHPGVDLHLCVHPESAATAAAQSGGAAAAPGPLVSERFTTDLPARSDARARLGLGEEERIVLMVAGSWGVGQMAKTFSDVAATGRYNPLAVCGRNGRLQSRLAAKGQGHVLGWTDDMPALMAAADVLVQNAGGLTCMEAFAAGLPVVSFRPIAGHGRENALHMERAGVAPLARDRAELAAVLDRATGPEGAQQVAAARAMFAGDAAREVLELAGHAGDGQGKGLARRAAADGARFEGLQRLT